MRSNRRRNVATYWLVGILTAAIAACTGLALVRDAGAPRAATLSDARAALDGASTLSIIGDSTGNDADEWVALWAADLGRSRQVTVQQWLRGDWRPEQLTYGDRGARLTIWNAGEPGGAAAWAVGQLGTVQPEPPDLTLISVGHNNTSDDIVGQLDQLQQQLDPGVPLVLLLQNPGRGDRQKRQAATLHAANSWARDHRVPTIDVTAAFTDPDRQMVDDAHPNAAGSRVWAERVGAALG